MRFGISMRKRLRGTMYAMDHSFWGYTRHIWGQAWKDSGGDLRGMLITAVVAPLVAYGVYLSRGTFDFIAVLWVIGITLTLGILWFSGSMWRASHKTHLNQRAEIEQMEQLYLQEFEAKQALDQEIRMVRLQLAEAEKRARQSPESTTHEN